MHIVKMFIFEIKSHMSSDIYLFLNIFYII